MKTKVNGGEPLLVMVAVTSTILLTIISLPPYFLSNYSAEATSSGRVDDGQSSEDLGKEEQEGRDDGQSSEDLGKEEQDEASPQAAGQNAPDREESDGVIEGDPNVNQELLNQLRGGEDIKGSGTAEGEAEGSGGGGDDNISPEDLRGGEVDKMAPVAISGNNAYVVWWTNDTTGNNEVIFRASTDGGQTFGDKINLSNTTNANSTRAEIDSGANSVVVTWWETNQTDDTPVMRLSSDNGATFGPLLQLGTNATIGQSE
jgi:hypothetical protein